MEVVALVPGREHPSARYRVQLFASHLTALGMPLRIEPIEQAPLARLRQITTDRRRQVVFLQRKLLPVWQTLLLRRSAGAFVYDFDDAVFLRDSFDQRGSRSWTRMARFRATIALADCVFAGNRYLADHACRWVKASKVEVIPTCVDPSGYPAARHADLPPARLAWIGSSSTLRALEHARPLLESIGQSIPEARLRVICSRFPSLRHLIVEPSLWSSQREAADLSESDVGISLLADDPWSRGKCGLKILQYMAAGLPVVASPVGVHREMIRAGHGYLPQRPQRWIESIRALVRDSALRREMGRAARAFVEEFFSPVRWGGTWAGRLHDLAVGV